MSVRKRTLLIPSNDTSPRNSDYIGIASRLRYYNFSGIADNGLCDPSNVYHETYIARLVQSICFSEQLGFYGSVEAKKAASL